MIERAVCHRGRDGCFLSFRIIVGTVPECPQNRDAIDKMLIQEALACAHKNRPSQRQEAGD